MSTLRLDNGVWKNEANFKKLIYSNTLTSDTANIDTGDLSSILSDYADLRCIITNARTDRSTANVEDSYIVLTLNSDTDSGNYRQAFRSFGNGGTLENYGTKSRIAGYIPLAGNPTIGGVQVRTGLSIDILGINDSHPKQIFSKSLSIASVGGSYEGSIRYITYIPTSSITRIKIAAQGSDDLLSGLEFRIYGIRG